ncbi:MAG: DedA family protein [Gemmatimonadaceae bacterium]
MDGVLAWFTSLPPVALYLALAVTAALENVFPPLPADTIVAFGSFLAAGGHAAPVTAFLATWIGNIAGAMAMYAAGRRFGAEGLRSRFRWLRGERGDARLKQFYDRNGMLGLFVSRFLPGVRALVPPFAGALRIPPLRAAAVMGTASGIWYAAISVFAYRVGSNWEYLQARVGAFSRGAAIAAAAVAILAGAAWLILRRRLPDKP